MSFSAEDLKSILLQQQTQFEQAQLRLIDTLTQRLNIQPPVGTSSDQPVSSIDSLTAAISEFHYDPASGYTFNTWYQRWED